MPATLLVTGAAGQFAQRVLHHLVHTLDVDPRRIVATTRRPAALAALAAQGAVVRTADFDDAASLPAAFAGVDRLLLVSTDVLDRPGHRLAQHRAAVAAAAQAGVQHVVYTSMPNADRSPILFAPDHAGTEAALAASTLPGWTVLRNHWYFENLLATLPAMKAAGDRWFHAAGEGRLAIVARDDLARAAATVLAGDGGGRQVRTLSGGQALTTSEQAALLGDALGRPVTPVPVPLEALVQGMVGAGLPEPVARVFASFDTHAAQGLGGTVTDDLQRITGRAPQTYAAWLAENRDRLRALA